MTQIIDREAVSAVSVPTPPGHKWVNTRTAMRIWNRSHSIITRWCYQGVFQEIGCPVRKDHTGHWQILVCVGELSNLSNLS